MKLEFLRPYLKYLPEVDIPKKKVPFKEKLMWTSLVLVLFFLMGVVYPVGVTPETLASKIQGFEQMTMIFASEIGSLTSVGIGPIVTASIILQLMSGAEMIDVDLKTKDGKALFQGAQKILTVLIAFFEAGALVIATSMVGQAGLPLLQKIVEPITSFTILQIALGSILLMFMDEIVSKWGIGSGISLFIAGGVSKTILVGALNPLMQAGAFQGAIPSFIQQMMLGSLQWVILFPVIGTVVIFLLTAFGESMRLEIPLSYGGIRGIGGRFPLKFFYVSNIPVILAAALLANVSMWSSLAGVDETTSVAEMSFVQEIIYRITSLVSLGELYGVVSPGRWPILFDLGVLFHLVIYLLVFVGLCVLFGQFWVQTTGMDSDSVAKQIREQGMQIPGFRRDERVIKRVLNRYIPQITIISSIAVGLVAALADLMGALGSGTGILLTVGILYRMYEELQKEQMADMSPMFRRFLGVE